MDTATLMPNLSPTFGKSRRLCLALAWLATLGFVILPVVSVTSILFPDMLNHVPSAMVAMDVHSRFAISGATSLPLKLGILACDAVPTGLTMWAQWSLRLLFLGYARGEVFSPRALHHLNHVAFALFASVLTNMVMLAPESLLGSWALGPGHRSITLAIGSGEIIGLFVAGVALVIARVMAEARRIADDNASIV